MESRLAARRLTRPADGRIVSAEKKNTVQTGESVRC